MRLADTPCGSVPVLVMHVGYVRMRMLEPAVPVPMGMWLAGRVVRPVLVLVMDVVHVRMGMFHRLVGMLVLVVLGEMQIDAEPHESARRQELQRQWLCEEDDGGARPEKRRG
jgi:hypothetical protein